jgi:hypothetical protein
LAITLIQRSFAAGEIAPEIQSRVDQVKYQTGLKTLRNAYVKKSGGLQNRPGSLFVREIKDSTRATRLIPFIFSNDQTYAIEMGHQYFRFIKNDEYITDLTVNITGITQANPGVFTAVGHGLSVGQEVILNGIGGMVGLNGRQYKINTTPTANTFTLTLMDGTVLDTTILTAYTSGGTFSRVYEIATNYDEADLFEIQYDQSADVITLAHNNYPLSDLNRIADNNWFMSLHSFAPSFFANTTTNFLAGAAGAIENIYLITAISEETGEESLPIAASLIPSPSLITGITASSTPVITTSANHNLMTDAYVRFAINFGSEYYQMHNRTFKIIVLSPTTFSIINFSTAGFAAYVAAADTATCIARVHLSAAPTISVPNEVYVNPTLSGVSDYNFYKEKNGTFGLIGISSNGYFQDTGQDPSGAKTPPQYVNPFYESGKYPSTVAYVKQRLMLAGTQDDPERIYGSAIGEYSNFYRGSPIADNDPIQFELAGGKVRKIKHLVELNQPLVFTDGGEWKLNGTGSGLVTPSEVNPEQQSYNGASRLRPLVINGDALYVQARGSVVRDFANDFQIDGYRGNDLTTFSYHLVEKNTLVDWCYQQIPNSVVWIVRNDGVLLGITHMKEQQIIGWHRHDFRGGTVESVCSIPIGSEDVLYLVINRTIDGVQKRYIERLASRIIFDVMDNIFMDSAVTYDGFNAGVTTLTLTSGGTYTENDLLTCTASASTFLPTDVGNEIHFFTEGDVQLLLKFKITAYTSATVVQGYPVTDVPVSLQNVAYAFWARAVDTVIGLDHLEGETVSVFADRAVAASPNNSDYDLVTVVNGQITLDKCYSKIHVGIPFVTDVETLDVDTAQGETLSNKKKLTSRITGRFQETRGVFIGEKPPSDDDVDPLEGLNELKIREAEGYNEPVDLLTGEAELNIQAAWNNNGRVFIRQVDPLPLAILSITAEGLFPFKGGN